MNAAGKCECPTVTIDGHHWKYVPDWDKCVLSNTTMGPQCHGGNMNSVGKCDCPPKMNYVPDWDKCVDDKTSTGP